MEIKKWIKSLFEPKPAETYIKKSYWSSIFQCKDCGSIELLCLFPERANIVCPKCGAFHEVYNITMVGRSLKEYVVETDRYLPDTLIDKSWEIKNAQN